MEVESPEMGKKWIKVISAAVTVAQALLVSSHLLVRGQEESDANIKKFLVQVVPGLIKETRASCTKVLAGLLANNRGRFE